MKKLLLLLFIIFVSCEKEEFVEESECCTECCIPARVKPNVSSIQQVCCDWDAANFQFEFQGHNVNQLHFTNSPLCNNNLCIYP